jgi:hypothetical protein
MNSLTWLGVVLIIVWIVARVALAMTGALLHLIWILALVLLAIGIIRRLKG